MNVVPCLTWVKRGAAKQHPDRVHLAEEDVTTLVQGAQTEGSLNLKSDSESLSDSDAESSDGSKRLTKEKCKSPTKNETKTNVKFKDNNGGCGEDQSEEKDAVDKRYQLSDYDDDDEVEGNNPLKVAGLAFYSSNADDPYLARGRSAQQDEDSDDEDLEIRPDDNLIAVGKAHGDYCNLEVWNYNENEQNLYCHHDLMLPSFPLCVEWLDFDPGDDKPGSFIAVGSLVPDIDIWDIDVIDTLEPAFTLAGIPQDKPREKKLKRSANMTGHTDAVLDLSWNKLQRNVLSSASADFTVGLWDLQEGNMVLSLTKHAEKVQSIQWHPEEAHMLLSGSFDGTAKVCDCRSPDDSEKSWTLPGEVERVLWNDGNPYTFFVSCDTGHVIELDVRSTEPLFTLSAHSQAVTGLSLCSFTSTCLATASDDKTVKVWDIKDNKPSLVLEKNMQMGELQCCSFSPDSPLILAMGGEREMRIINLQKNEKVAGCFGYGSVAKSSEPRREEIAARSSHKLFDSEENTTEEDDQPAAATARVVKKSRKKKSKKKKLKAD